MNVDEFKTTDYSFTGISAPCLIRNSEEEYAALADLTKAKHADVYMHFQVLCYTREVSVHTKRRDINLNLT